MEALMNRVHLSTILRTAAYRNLRPWGETDREKVRENPSLYLEVQDGEAD